MRKHLPNIITLLNLFCGCCALTCIFYNQFIEAFYFIFLGGLADYADGLVARLLNIKSTLGKELDSMADMVTFGVVPGAIVYMLLIHGSLAEGDAFPMEITYRALPGFLLAVFAGYRLAKFNLDTRQSDSFLGLPVPSCTLFFAGLMLIYHNDTFGLRNVVSSMYLLYPAIAIFSGLMISELPMFSFKLKALKWKGNEIRFIFAIVSIILLLLLREAAFSLIVVVYVILAILLSLTGKKEN